MVIGKERLVPRRISSRAFITVQALRSYRSSAHRLYSNNPRTGYRPTDFLNSFLCLHLCSSLFITNTSSIFRLNIYVLYFFTVTVPTIYLSISAENPPEPSWQVPAMLLRPSLQFWILKLIPDRCPSSGCQWCLLRFMVPLAGCHNTTLDASSSGWRTQWPGILKRASLILSDSLVTLHKYNMLSLLSTMRNMRV